jgi:deoxyadenosine/deoxycytidine kinase
LQGHIHKRDYQTYRDLYETTMQFLPPPDLVIYLRASVPTLMNRISHRGRTYEQTIASDYLDGLNNLYETWIDNFTLCPILAVPADDLDFVSHPGHLRLIIQKVDDKLTGKEEVVFEAEEVARASDD